MIGARPAPLLPQNGLLTSTACTFSTTCVFAYVCTFRRAVVIRDRPAPSFDQYGLLASTACTFLRRLMISSFVGVFKNLHASAAGDPFWVAWVVSLRLPSGGPAPKGTPRTRSGSSGVVSWKSPGPLWEASRPPKAPRSRSKDGPI